ncbi:MAG: PAS domain S-box protein [Acidimicrobiales bacterium]
MDSKLFDASTFQDLDDASNFISGVLEASTEYSIIATDLDDCIRLWNQGALILFGYESDEAIGQLQASALFVDEDIKAGVSGKIAEEAMRSGKWEGLVTGRRKSGETFPLRLVETPRLGIGGQVVGFLLIAKDISDEQRLAKALADTQLYTRSLIESNIDALMTTDALGTITDVNEQMMVLAGRTREELIGTMFKDHFTDPLAAEEGIRQVLQDGRVTNYELIARSRNGELTEVSYNASIFHDHEGKLQGMIASARDVTQQKDLERQLHSQQLYTRSLFESNVDALMTTDALGNITDVNQQMEMLTGRDHEELIGSPFRDHFVDADAADEGIRLALQTGRATDYELTARAEGGIETVVSYNGTTFFDENDHLLGVFASARDLTEFKLAEEKIRIISEEAERANQAKSEFLSRMSHELRTPLNAILGFTQLLKMDELEGEPALRVNQISLAGGHLLNLINEVLDISRVEAGQIGLSLEPVQLSTVLAGSVQLVTGLYDHAGIDLSVDVSDDQWAHVDAQRMKQILLNLLSNGVKYNRPNGAVVISCERVDGAQLIRVADTGPGVPELRLEELFVPFNRLGADSSGVEGSGLGLSLSRALAQAMGGDLILESTSPFGTTFLLSVPASEPNEVNVAIDDTFDGVGNSVEGWSADGPRPTRSHTILYIEDNLANVDLIEDALGGLKNVTVVAAIQGSLGLELARAGDFSMVLLDIHLPDITGEEVLRQLKLGTHTKDIPVVMLTADISARPALFAALGARDLQTKPIDVNHLINLVNTILLEVEAR